jgi:hypothetical protein
MCRPIEELEMIRLIHIAALTAMALVGATQAYAKVNTLAECYEIVIADCNAGNRPPSCANAGLDQCDATFATPLPRKPGLFFGDEPGETIH